MLTGAELFCIDIDHLEELRICLAPAPRTTTHSTASTIPIFLFAPKRFLGDVSIVENKECLRVRN